MKKLLCCILSLILVLSLAACGNPAADNPVDSAAESSVAENTEQSQTETSDSVVPPVQTESSKLDENETVSPYAGILDSYYTAISEEWDAQTLMDAGMNYMITYAYDQTQPLTHVGYTIMDIDENGVEELLIGSIGNDEGTYRMIYDLYTLVDDEPVLVFSGGERNRYYLCSDAAIANEASNSAFQSAVFYFRLNGDTLALQEGVLYDADYDADNPWFLTDNTNWNAAGDTPISEDEALAIQQRYLDTYVAVSYTPFSEY